MNLGRTYRIWRMQQRAGQDRFRIIELSAQGTQRSPRVLVQGATFLSGPAGPWAVFFVPNPNVQDSSGESLTKRGNGLRESKRYKEAIDHFRSALSLNPQNEKALTGIAACVEELMEQAERKTNKGTLKEARADLRLALEAKPDDSRIYIKLARLEGELEETSIPFASLPEYLLFALLRRGSVPYEAEVEDMSEKPFSPLPQSSRSFLGDLLVNISMIPPEPGATLLSPERTQKQPKATTKVVVQIPSGKRMELLNSLLAEARRLVNRDEIEEAIGIYDRILLFDPNQTIAWTAKGNLLIGKGRIAEAINCFERVLEIKLGEPTAKSLLGKCYMLRGELERAVTLLKEVLEANPKENTATGFLFDCYIKMGERGELIQYFKALLKKEPGNARAFQCLGRVYLMFGQYEEAIKYFEQSLDLEPKNLWSRDFLATCYREMGELKKALSCYRKTLEMFPEDLAAMLGLGECSLRMREYDEARSWFNKVLWYEYNQQAIYGMARIFYYSEKHYAKALKTVQRIAEFWEPSLSVRNLAGDILRKLGKIDAAVKVYQAVLAMLKEEKLLSRNHLIAQIRALRGSAACDLAKQHKIEARQKLWQALAIARKARVWEGATVWKMIIAATKIVLLKQSWQP